MCRKWGWHSVVKFLRTWLVLLPFIPFLHKDKLQGSLQATPVFSSKWSLNPLTHLNKHSFKDPKFFSMLQMMIWSKAFLRAGVINQSFQLFFKNTIKTTKQNTLQWPQLNQYPVCLPEWASCGAGGEVAPRGQKGHFLVKAVRYYQLKCWSASAQSSNLSSDRADAKLRFLTIISQQVLLLFYSIVYYKTLQKHWQNSKEKKVKSTHNSAILQTKLFTFFFMLPFSPCPYADRIFTVVIIAQIQLCIQVCLNGGFERIFPFYSIIFTSTASNTLSPPFFVTSCGMLSGEKGLVKKNNN